MNISPILILINEFGTVPVGTRAAGFHRILRCWPL